MPQVKLAARFKGRLKAWLQAEQPELLKTVPAKVWWIKWVADFPPVGSGEAALKYLANYLCKPPLHESQIEHWNAKEVTFRYRESGGRPQHCTVNRLNFDEFAIDKPLAGGVRLKQQLVARGDSQFSFLSHIKRNETSNQLENTFRTIPTLNFERIIFDGNHHDRFIFVKTTFAMIKSQSSASGTNRRVAARGGKWHRLAGNAG